MGTTLKEAQNLERRLKKEVERKGGRIIEGTSKQQRHDKSAAFSGFAKHWFDNYCQANNKPSELNSKESILRIHLVPHFKDHDLREIDSEQVTSFIANQKTKGLTAKTINNHLAVLRKLFNTACDWGYLEVNPMNGIKLLKAPQPAFDFYTVGERDRFLIGCQDREPFWYSFFLTAFLTGMRLGELCALNWNAVDFGNDLIEVNASVWQGQRGTPKSGRTRRIPLHSSLKDLLSSMQGESDEPVFKNLSGESLTGNSIRKPFRRIQEAVGLKKIRFHDIRHSFASQLILIGQPMKVVQELLGHSDIRMTDIYSHLTPNANQDAIDSLLEAPKEPKSGHNMGIVIDFSEVSNAQ